MNRELQQFNAIYYDNIIREDDKVTRRNGPLHQWSTRTQTAQEAATDY